MVFSCEACIFRIPFTQKLKKVFGCGKKDDANRRASMMSKKKSMSSTMQPPIEVRLKHKIYELI